MLEPGPLSTETALSPPGHMVCLKINITSKYINMQAGLSRVNTFSAMVRHSSPNDHCSLSALTQWFDEQKLLPRGLFPVLCSRLSKSVTLPTDFFRPWRQIMQK